MLESTSYKWLDLYQVIPMFLQLGEDQAVVPTENWGHPLPWEIEQWLCTQQVKVSIWPILTLFLWQSRCFLNLPNIKLFRLRDFVARYEYQALASLARRISPTRRLISLLGQRIIKGAVIAHTWQSCQGRVSICYRWSFSVLISRPA
jgi:hypothetical protein